MHMYRFLHTGIQIIQMPLYPLRVKRRFRICAKYMVCLPCLHQNECINISIILKMSYVANKFYKIQTWGVLTQLQYHFSSMYASKILIFLFFPEKRTYFFMLMENIISLLHDITERSRNSMHQSWNIFALSTLRFG